MINDRLRELAAMLSGHVPAPVVEDLLTYIRVDEAEIGLQSLCDVLSDEEESLTSAEIELIHELGEALGLPPDRIEQVDELNIGE
ncbi:MafI family immunity protein [Streptomyces sp. G-G2]|uniref:MafI family immunity protein n=1 Tax=Streptomyces sp. G-G2 TaxID=3046201 RepID=UPI0024BBB681|nr:MafI family immunity protein [Streptomyces sp. G-G2]MDJ0383207.1 MafI family immunity protein [Streptomyces sp. G-G2]